MWGKERRTLTGAWIETLDMGIILSICLSRTLTGAWIETAHISPGSLRSLVAPSRVRGLKPSD